MFLSDSRAGDVEACACGAWVLDGMGLVWVCGCATCQPNPNPNRNPKTRTRPCTHPDHTLRSRTGLPEVIFGEGKTVAQIRDIFLVMEGERQRHPERNVGVAAMATRVSAEVYRELEPDVPGLVYYSDARIAALPAVKESSWSPATSKKDATVAVLCAGTSDLPVAEEAAITLELSGAPVVRLYDVGVAGLHRLLQQLPVVEQASVVICVAGMDGALPSVVGGLARCPVIAVPTSVGYGAAFSGVAPLLTMLNSCSPGVSVVNIDNGFGAATCALKMLDLTVPKTQEDQADL